MVWRRVARSVSEAPSAHSVTPAIDDGDSSDANVVVRTNGCTGTLITSQIVLTANHCIYGQEDHPGLPCHPKTLGDTAIGRDAPVTSKPSVKEVEAVTMLNAC